MAEDEKLLNLLKDWTVESIFPILKESGVGADELQYLTETDLEKIFPDLKYLGIKAKFRSKLLNLKNNAFANTLQPSIAQSAIFHIEEMQSILEATPIGRDALEYYTHNSTLTPQHQQAIVNCVVDYFILKGHTLQVKDMQSIAECICKRFCGELTVFPIIRVLMTKKTQKAYEHLLQFINSNLLCLQPTSFITDFEHGLRNAIKKIFPDTKLKGCWFHFKQAVRRRALKFEELSKTLNRNTDSIRLLNKLMSLPLLDPDNILIGFNLCKQEALKNEAFQADCGNIFDRMLEYFERQWLQKITPRHLSLFGENIRTTSAVEGHKSYLATKLSKHGSVWEFLRFIRDDEIQKYIELKNGALNIFDKPRKKFRDKSQLIDTLWLKLSSEKIDVNMFLRNVTNKNNGIVDDNFELSFKIEEEEEDEIEGEIVSFSTDILCEVCFVNKKSMILKPCRHGKICGPCFERLAESHSKNSTLILCPFCRQVVKTSEQFFI